MQGAAGGEGCLHASLTWNIAEVSPGQALMCSPFGDKTSESLGKHFCRTCRFILDGCEQTSQVPVSTAAAWLLLLPGHPLISVLLPPLWNMLSLLSPGSNRRRSQHSLEARHKITSESGKQGSVLPLPLSTVQVT